MNFQTGINFNEQIIWRRRRTCRTGRIQRAIAARWKFRLFHRANLLWARSCVPNPYMSACQRKRAEYRDFDDLEASGNYDFESENFRVKLCIINLKVTVMFLGKLYDSCKDIANIVRWNLLQLIKWHSRKYKEGYRRKQHRKSVYLMVGIFTIWCPAFVTGEYMCGLVIGFDSSSW